MTIFKTKKRLEIDKSIGNLKISSFHYGKYENGKHKDWTEVHCWYDEDCENCPCGWETRSYEGECGDCGCLISKDGDFTTPTIVCMMPTWLKSILVKWKTRKWGEE